MLTRVAPADPADIAEAARLILAGEPVAVPTETVYGLAADATSGDAVARIYEAKGRPSFNPLIVHVRNVIEARAVAIFTGLAEDLADRFWPGPLTLVLPLRSGAAITPLVTAGGGTIALRVPAHPVMQSLLEACGRPLAAPSANASGTVSPTRAQHVWSSLGGRIPLILDGGPSQQGLESTIFDTIDRTILRPGPLTRDDLRQVVIDQPNPASVQVLRAPGQLASHYAPSKPLRLNAVDAAPDEWLIGFGPVAGDDNLSSSGDLIKAAARLFDALHRADAADRPRIAVAPMPAHGLGTAINDRLTRAASR